MAPSNKKRPIVEFLVNEVQAHESLWRKTSKDYKNVFVKANAWRGILSNLKSTFNKKDLIGCNVNSIGKVKSTWKNTCDSYRRKKKSLVESPAPV